MPRPKGSTNGPPDTTCIDCSAPAFPGDRYRAEAPDTWRCSRCAMAHKRAEASRARTCLRGCGAVVTGNAKVCPACKTT